MRVAIDQLDVALARPDQNFAQVAADVKEAAKAGADVIVIPEMWNTGYALDQLGDLADLDGQRTKQTLARLARDNQINIVGGSVAIKRGKRFYNTTYVYDRTGQLVGDYDKVHLFGLMNEGEFISAGHAPNRFALDG
ncbi:MAG: Aliphatic amidase amiE [Limosilactobacillus fermentum]|jgi:omega-amidase